MKTLLSALALAVIAGASSTAIAPVTGAEAAILGEHGFVFFHQPAQLLGIGQLIVCVLLPLPQGLY